MEQLPPGRLESTLKPSNNEKDLESWVSSVVTSFSLIEPWHDAHSSDSEVQKIIMNVNLEGVKYYQALDRSKSVAQHGFTFCGEASALCDFLLGDNSVEDLIRFIDGMKKTAALAYQEAREVSAEFRSVRTGLFQITQGIPAELERIHENQVHALELKAKVQKHWKSFKNTADIISVGIGLAFPFEFVVIPAVLDLTDLIKEKGEHHYKKKIAAREGQVLLCTEAKEQLSKVASDIAELVNHIDLFAKWWIEQETMLKSLGTKIFQLDHDQIGRLRVKAIKSEWDAVKNSYMQYVTNITKLQDYYPSSQDVTVEGSKRKHSMRRKLLHWAHMDHH